MPNGCFQPSKRFNLVKYYAYVRPDVAEARASTTLSRAPTVRFLKWRKDGVIAPQEYDPLLVDDEEEDSDVDIDAEDSDEDDDGVDKVEETPSKDKVFSTLCVDVLG